MSETIATVVQLYIYPIKSMAGIAVEEAHVGLDGILGDRQYSFVRADQAATNSFPWMTARQSARMLLHQPQFTPAPTPEQPEPLVRVRTPEGQMREATDATLREALAKEAGEPLFLLKSGRGLFDCQHLSLFSLASVRALAGESGASIDARQFRANIYMEPVSRRPFEEETWAGSLVQIADQVLTGVTQRDTRCMMVNLDPESGNQDPRVLRTIAQGHDRQAGIYANVVRPGVIRVGDSIRLVGKK
jgi:uncharacterized protein YcbX